MKRRPTSSRSRCWCSTARISATKSTRRAATKGRRSCCAARVPRRCTQSPDRSRWNAEWPCGWRPTTAPSAWWRESPRSCSGRPWGCDGSAPVVGGAPTLAQPQPHVVRHGTGDDPWRRDHIEAVEKREPAQKPFRENGFGFGGSEELVEQRTRRTPPPRGGSLGAGV